MWKKKFPFLLLVLVHVSGVFGSDELGEEISSYLESVRTLLTNHRRERTTSLLVGGNKDQLNEFQRVLKEEFFVDEIDLELMRDDLSDYSAWVQQQVNQICRRTTLDVTKLLSLSCNGRSYEPHRIVYVRLNEGLTANQMQRLHFLHNLIDEAALKTKALSGIPLGSCSNKLQHTTVVVLFETEPDDNEVRSRLTELLEGKLTTNRLVNSISPSAIVGRIQSSKQLTKKMKTTNTMASLENDHIKQCLLALQNFAHTSPLCIVPYVCIGACFLMPFLVQFGHHMFTTTPEEQKPKMPEKSKGKRKTPKKKALEG